MQQPSEPTKPKRTPLTNAERGRLMAYTDVPQRTIDAYWQGGTVKPWVRRALDAACRRIGKEPPPGPGKDVTADSGENGPQAA